MVCSARPKSHWCNRILSGRLTFARPLDIRTSLAQKPLLYLRSLREKAGNRSREQSASARRTDAWSSVPDAGISPVLASFLKQRLGTAPLEQMLVLFFGTDGTCLGIDVTASGNRSRVAIQPKRLLHQARKLHANKIVMAHNHPNGSARPSAADIGATALLHQMAVKQGLHLAEHFIVGSEGIFSMRRARLLP
ncbi:JAB domain-containing protein [Novosphingobium subterraneum]|uniref:JAB domain-containing protein n=1 Tax=Novosphingobium TaxID=165696 RepID=UPI0018D1FF90|nr:JAB domain-containing protein [Novosphingobium sp. CCH12-A3]